MGSSTRAYPLIHSHCTSNTATLHAPHQGIITASTLALKNHGTQPACPLQVCERSHVCAVTHLKQILHVANDSLLSSQFDTASAEAVPIVHAVASSSKLWFQPSFTCAYPRPLAVVRSVTPSWTDVVVACFVAIQGMVDPRFLVACPLQFG